MRSLHCSDAEFDCEAVIRANSYEEILNQAARHVKEVHGVDAIPQMQKELQNLIRQE